MDNPKRLLVRKAGTPHLFSDRLYLETEKDDAISTARGSDSEVVLLEYDGSFMKEIIIYPKTGTLCMYLCDEPAWYAA